MQIDNLFEVMLLFQGYGRTPEQQAGYQLMAIGLTLVIAIVGGLLTGENFNFLLFLIIFFWSVKSLSNLLNNIKRIDR